MAGNIPTTPFDPARHVLVVRENKEGREQFVTLESLVEAEQPIERAIEAREINVTPLLDEIERVKNAVRSVPSHADVARMIAEVMPSQKLSTETTGVLIELTQAFADLKRTQLEARREIDLLKATLIELGDKLPA